MKTMQEACGLLTELYKRQLEVYPNNEYLLNRSENKPVMLRHVEVAQKYMPYVKGKVLDWGCRQAVDSCLIRFYHGDDVTIFGCDIMKREFDIFYHYAKLQYEETKPCEPLPYASETFDFIIASGVLEHVPNDRDYLKELYRVLKPNGYLAVTFLPNKLSINEFVSSFVFKHAGHPRKYSLAFTKNEFLHHGFVPVTWGYHQVFPSLSSGNYKNQRLKKVVDFLFKFNSFAERLWPLKLVATNIYITAQKKTHIC